MIKIRYYFAVLLISTLVFIDNLFGQEEEKINYFQLEPFDDSLFIQIQQLYFIDPPDPKAEIIADLRDPGNQTLTIRGTIYPFLALTPELRARVEVYPFKLNLEESIDYASVFTRVINRIKIKRIISPPTLFQILPSMFYINPFLQVFGGERFGASIKKDIGISLGLGTPYSGPFETNFVEANLHILGFFAGGYSVLDELVEIKRTRNYNNLFSTAGFQLGYVIPFGNFLQLGYLRSLKPLTESKRLVYTENNNPDYHVKIIEGNYFNWEFRYPISILGATRSKFYFARYLNELHFGYSGRELSVAGSTFDFRLDAMTKSDDRRPQLVLDVLVQKMFESWGFSSLAMGPSIIITEAPDTRVVISSIFFNLRLKIGTSL